MNEIIEQLKGLNWIEIIGAIFVIVSAIVGATEGKKDDKVFKAITDFFSFLTAKNAAGTFKSPLTRSKFADPDELTVTRTREDGAVVSTKSIPPRAM